METSNSDAKYVVLHAQSDRSCLGLIETCYSVTEAAVLHVKTTGEGWNQYSLDTHVLITLLCVLKTTDEVRDPHRLISLVLNSRFCMLKTTDEGWNPYRLVMLVQITLFFMHKTAGENWDT